MEHTYGNWLITTWATRAPLQPPTLQHSAAAAAPQSPPLMVSATCQSCENFHEKACLRSTRIIGEKINILLNSGETLWCGYLPHAAAHADFLDRETVSVLLEYIFGRYSR